MELSYQYISIFFIFLTTINHLHPLQVENCDSNSRLVVYEYDNGKFRLKRVKHKEWHIFGPKLNKYDESNFGSLEDSY